MPRALALAPVLAALVATGCAAAGKAPLGAAAPRRAHCLANPDEVDPTALVFLFCRQMP